MVCESLLDVNHVRVRMLLYVFVCSGSATVREMSDSEKAALMQTDEFLGFFDRSSRIIERFLSDDQNIYFDYSHDHNDDTTGKESGYNLNFTFAYSKRY